jgi:hypothetical protein
VHLKLTESHHIVRLPVNTLIFRSAGLQIATLDANSDVILKAVTIARDFGEEVEINSGVLPGESVVINPPDSLTQGQHVSVVSSATGGKDSQ